MYYYVQTYNTHLCYDRHSNITKHEQPDATVVNVN